MIRILNMSANQDWHLFIRLLLNYKVVLFSSSLFKGHGVGAWAASVVRVEVKAEQFGVPILKAGPRYTPTASNRSGPATNRIASGCAIGTKSFTTGS